MNQNKPLLRDLPGYSDSLHNNSIVLSKITDGFNQLDVNIKFPRNGTDNIIAKIAKLLEDATFEIINQTEITIDDKEGFAQLIWNTIEDDVSEIADFDFENQDEVSSIILDEVIEFVDENYTQK